MSNPEAARRRNKRYRERHKERLNEKARQAWRENKNGIRERREKYVEENQENVNEAKRDYVERNRAKVNARNRDWKRNYRRTRPDDHKAKVRVQGLRRRKEMRAEAIREYGGRCVCCGETTPEFLCIDHVYGGGSAHRKSIKRPGGAEFLKWLKREGWPKGDYQLLCHNCNTAKSFSGGCPHQRIQVLHG